MSENEEMQNDEREALQSIYEGDELFKELNPKVYQYKYGPEEDYKSFLVEIKWGENYPTELPQINMDTFFNRNLLPQVKEKITKALTEEAEQWLGCGMTYTLFECLKDKIEELTVDQPDKPIVQAVDLGPSIKTLSIADNSNESTKAPKKEQLTKSQKRRRWNVTDHKGEKPRGWDWVDLVRHLSQTGPGKDFEQPSWD
ncbi:RWDD4 family protein [Megaselia abdita]